MAASGAITSALAGQAPDFGRLSIGLRGFCDAMGARDLFHGGYSDGDVDVPVHRY